MELANNLKHYRCKQKMTLRELGNISNVDFSNISKIERGLRTKVSIDTVVRLASALNVSLDQLVLDKVVEVEEQHGKTSM